MIARRVTVLALALTAIALGLLSVLAGRAHPGWWFAGESVEASALELLAGTSLIGAGAAAWWRRPASRFGPLLIAAGLAWFIPEWNSPDTGTSLSFSAGLLLLVACPALVAHAALAYPGGRLRSAAERTDVGLAYLASIGLLGLLPAVLFDPAAEGCAQCPGNLLLVEAHRELADGFRRVGLALGLVWVGLFLLLAVHRLRRTSAAERPVILLVLASAGAYLSAVAWHFQHSLSRGFLSNDSWGSSLWIVQAVALCLLALGPSWQWVRSRRTRSALAALVVELESSPGPGGLRAALARRLGDPSLELLYPLLDGRLVDATARSLPPGPDRQFTPLLSGGRRLAVVAHRPGLFDDPALTDAVASAARLTIDNERLQTELRAQVEDLQASRARIVEAGDTERCRLERDLHDGAQQRLVALSLSIGLAAVRGEDRNPRLEQARRELDRLLAELRQLAHGLYPVALAEEGLAASVETLAEESPVRLRFACPLVEQRLAAPVESAAYLVIREMVRDERRRFADVATILDGDRLIVEVTGDGDPPADLLHLEDRIGAVGGRLQLELRDDGSTRLRAELPCG